MASKIQNIAALHCKDALRRAELGMIAAECGFDIENAHGPNGVNGPGIDMFLIDFHSILDAHGQELSNILSYLKSSGAEALIWTDMDRLDVAYALFPATRCHFIVDASDAEAMLILTRASRRGKMDQLHDNSRDDGFDELHKMSDELAGFAKALAKMAGNESAPDDPESIGFADKPISFRPAPSASMSPFIEESKAPTGIWSAKQVRELIRKRRLRDQHFESDLFADPAWDILLDLMAARLEGNRVSVSSLCIAASVPATTALRWITSMTESGMLKRQMDPNDARRVFIELSENSISRLERYFTEVGSQNPTI